MNPYLLSLVFGPRYSRFGDTALAFTKVAPNSATQPSRLYAVFATQGGVTHNEDAAKSLQGAGFSVVGDSLDASEQAFLQHTNPAAWSGVTYAWFWECTGTRGPGLSCTHPEGITSQTTPLSEAMSTGIVSRKDLRAVEQVTGRGQIGTVTVEGGTGLWTWEDLGKAVATVKAWYSLKRGLERMRATRAAGIPLSPGSAAVEAHGLKVLASIAQPVDMFVKEYPQYKESMGADSAEAGFGAAQWVIPAIWAVTAISVTLTMYAAVANLAGNTERVQEANNDVWKENTLATQVLRDCIVDTNRGFFEKRQCQKALDLERGAVPQTTPTVAGIADAAGAVMGLMIAGAAIYLGAPLVKSFAAGAKERMDERRESRAAEKQAAAQQQIVAQQFPALELVEEDEIA